MVNNNIREWQELDSSNIAAVCYVSDSGTLYVRFRSGKTYAYHHVPASEYCLLMAAESKGKYFNTCIRSDYHYERVYE